MKPEELLKLQDRVEEMAEEVRTLWSTLEAVHDAMGAALTDPATYRDAIYGMSRQAHRLKDELESLMDWLEERERAWQNAKKAHEGGKDDGENTGR